jgi:hypothetical protein
MVIDFHVEGIKAMRKRLRRFSGVTQRRIAVKAMRAGATKYAQHVRRRLKAIRTSLPSSEQAPEAVAGTIVNLFKSVKVSQVKRGIGAGVQFHVGYTGYARRYGHIIEFGNPSRGITPNPIWRAAIGQAQADVRARIVEVMQREIIKAVRKGL